MINDTGQVCHGFEIELDDIHSTDITYTYDYNHYGAPKIRKDNTDPAHPKVFVRYESAKDSSGNYLAFTAVPVVPVPPTQGHQCTNPGVNLGCEHFGVGNYGTPSVVRYNWLIDDGAGNLIHGPAVNVPAPAWVYYPPAPLQPVAKVQAVLVAPPPPPEVVPKEFGEALWVKAIKTTTHNNHQPELRDLVSDDPDDPGDVNWANREPDEIELEWQILQKEFANPGAGNDELAGGYEDLPNGDEVVTRRYEFYKYAGAYDEETNEIVCDKYPDPAPAMPECEVELLGDDIGAQMAGFNVESVLGLIDHLQDGVEGEAYPDRTVVIGGNSPYDVTTTPADSLPAGLAIDPLTGILTGTPSEFGIFSFSVHATDADGVSVSKDYVMTIASVDGIAPVTTAVVVPAPNGAGWNNADATVMLTATDDVGGSGVQSITTCRRRPARAGDGDARRRRVGDHLRRGRQHGDVLRHRQCRERRSLPGRGDQARQGGPAGHASARPAGRAVRPCRSRGALPGACHRRIRQRPRVVRLRAGVGLVLHVGHDAGALLGDRCCRQHRVRHVLGHGGRGREQDQAERGCRARGGQVRHLEGERDWRGLPGGRDASG